MRIFVTGTRGIPDIPGGVERHCQELYPRIVARGHEVILATRSSYVHEKMASWRGVRLLHLFSPRTKSLEALIHTFIAILAARAFKPDVLHLHAVGPGLMTPLARLLRMKVVVTNHGPDYDRQKWGSVAKNVLRLGEYLGGRFANEVIVISRVIADIVARRCGRTSHLVYNGVTLREQDRRTEFLQGIGVEPGRYILAVARFVPEKGLHDLIDAFKGLQPGQKLVIAGDADHESDYSRRIKGMSDQNPDIILTGYVTGSPLEQLYSHARLFVLPSYHEGLPIALLEAMSYGLSVLVSDIPANLEVDLPAERYFMRGDVENLREKMVGLLAIPHGDGERDALKKRVAEKYDWERLCEETIGVYEKAVGKRNVKPR